MSTSTLQWREVGDLQLHAIRIREEDSIVTWSVLRILLRLVKDGTQSNNVLVFLILLEGDKLGVDLVNELRCLGIKGQVVQARIQLVVRRVISTRDADA